MSRIDLETLRKREAAAAEKFEKAKKELELMRSRRSDAERKERTRRLINTGGLVHMVLGDEVDAGLLVGLLLKYKSIFGTGMPDHELKKAGDAFINEREKAKKEAKLKTREKIKEIEYGTEEQED